ncbi:MAG: hypothetical protein EXS49_00185 [Candidatus Pacebacteria bacterium]|nr:hypothetical protein [Candidatus Paceibacterota bacterium]
METENLKKISLISKIEGILFAYGEAISKDKLISLLFVEKSESPDLELEFNSAVTELKLKYESDSNSGLCVLESNNKFELVAKSELGPIINSLIKNEMEGDLSESALEVLSIIVYGGPIEKHLIDYIRGVNSSLAIKNLEMRGLVEKKSQEDKSIFKYLPSTDLICRLGVSKLEDTPDHERFKKLVESAKANFLSQNVK